MNVYDYYSVTITNPAHDLYRQIWSTTTGAHLFSDPDPEPREPDNEPAEDTEAEVPDVQEDEVPE